MELPRDTDWKKKIPPQIKDEDCRNALGLWSNLWSPCYILLFIRAQVSSTVYMYIWGELRSTLEQNTQQCLCVCICNDWSQKWSAPFTTCSHTRTVYSNMYKVYIHCTVSSPIGVVLDCSALLQLSSSFFLLGGRRGLLLGTQRSPRALEEWQRYIE